MSDLKGIEHLRNKLECKRSRVRKRYDFYEMKNIAKDLNVSVPTEFLHIKATLGWCGKAVDSLADRLVFHSFENDNFDLTEIFKMNNSDILFDNAILSALISSCCFVYISVDENKYPRLQVIDGANATGVLDPITNLLIEGYAVLERNKSGNPLVEAYFIKGETHIYQNKVMQIVLKNNAPYPLLVPIINRQDAVRPFGHSRISRACMKITEAALRTVKRSEISAEFYSYPQKYVLGMDEDAETLDKWKATMSSMLRIDKGENGDTPVVGQFQQQSMGPYIDQMKMFASLFAGETGLTVDDLGFVSDNPSSAEAIKASHENLRLTARKAQRDFGSGFLNVGYLAACLRDDFSYQRRQFYLTEPVWEPIFEPDAAMLSNMGDGIIKINQAVPGYFNTDNLRALTGIAPSKLKTISEQPIEQVAENG